MKRALIPVLVLSLVFAGFLIVTADTANHEDGEVIFRKNFTAPSVTENEDVDVKWTIDPRRPWLIFEITGGNSIGFGEIKVAGEYEANDATTYKLRTNWQGEVKIDSKMTNDYTGPGEADLLVDEEFINQNGSTYTDTYSPGYRKLTRSWKTFAKYNHDGEWVDYEDHDSNVKLQGKFNYKLDVPSGTNEGDYHTVVLYRAVAL